MSFLFLALTFAFCGQLGLGISDEAFLCYSEYTPPGPNDLSLQ